jgi:hypothetical protein
MGVTVLFDGLLGTKLAEPGLCITACEESLSLLQISAQLGPSTVDIFCDMRSTCAVLVAVTLNLDDVGWVEPSSVVTASDVATVIFAGCSPPLITPLTRVSIIVLLCTLDPPFA